MSDVRPIDANNLPSAATQGECLGMAAITQFYAFAERCLDWAKTTRSVQERAVYLQMGLQWLAAGARLQTFLQFKNVQALNLTATMEEKTT
ncbi:MAG TPA: hypothetical protein VMF32_01350 [Xanthobacteraceae bacterium]|nr:hypothetical protein [Xanthobacteraceae bacterium]